MTVLLQIHWHNNTVYLESSRRALSFQPQTVVLYFVEIDAPDEVIQIDEEMVVVIKLFVSMMKSRDEQLIAANALVEDFVFTCVPISITRVIKSSRWFFLPIYKIV